MHAASPWSGHYDVDQVIWATAHTTHHVDIGWHYLAHGSGVGELSGGGTYVALSDGNGALTLVVEAITHEQSVCINDGYAPGTAVEQNVTFTLAGSFSALPSLHVFYSSFDPSNAILMYEYQGIVKPSNGSITFTLLPDTLYTFSTRNSTKGSHPLPPPPAPFPTHYNDSFTTPTLYGQPHYWTDQSGVFEWYQSANSSHGGVVRQSVPVMPVGWCGDAAVAYSSLGDHSWRYVNLSVDVFIESAGTAVIAAAVSTGGCTGAGGSPAIALSITATGSWTLSNTTSLAYTFASGGKFKSGVWYHVQLSVGRDSIRAVIDGRVVHVMKVADWEDGLTGWVGIGSSFDYVQFDNLVVDAAVADGDGHHVAEPEASRSGALLKVAGSSEHRHDRP